MGLTLQQLLAAPDEAGVRSALLKALQGLGFVRHQLGVSPGTVTLSGSPTGAYACQLKVSTAGNVQSPSPIVQVQVSTDGGQTFGAPVVVPSNGQVTIPGAGVIATLSNGPAGSGTAFLLGDIYAFDLAVPTLPVSSWQPGSTPLALVENFAMGMADLYALAKAIASGGLIPYSYGPWMDLLGQGFYGLPRQPAQVAKHVVRVTDTGGTGPQPITAGSSYFGTAGGLRFVAISSGTLPLGGYLDVPVQAESPGAKYNVGIGAINVLLTPIPGATCANLDQGNGSSITQQGLDAESDTAYQTRCLARWPSLGLGANAQVYDLNAKAASVNVTRTRVVADSSVAGQVDIYLAGNSGGVDGATVAAVQTYLNSRVPLCTTVLAASAANHTVAVTGTVYVYRGYLANAQQAVLDALNSLINGADIGGTIYFSQIIGAIQGIQGVRDVVLTAPLADVVLAATQVAIPDLTGLAFVEV